MRTMALLVPPPCPCVLHTRLCAPQRKFLSLDPTIHNNSMLYDPYINGTAVEKTKGRAQNKVAASMYTWYAVGAPYLVSVMDMH